MLLIDEVLPETKKLVIDFGESDSFLRLNDEKGMIESSR